jgi:Ca2+-binding RTX toxin-like protein
MRPLLALLTALTCSGVLAGIASAGTVTLADGKLTYSGAAGETNRVFIFVEQEGIRTIDTTASVTAGQGCASLAGGEALCAHPLQKTVNFQILTGDMDDFVDFPAASFGGLTVVRGGAGNDELRGAGGLNVLDGGPGADIFHASVSCRDVVDYSSRTNPVTVTVGDGMANDGESGEQDSIPGDIGGVRGGHGNDTISFLGPVSGCADVRFSGRGGDDVLTARSFLSWLRGGGGEDTLTAPTGSSHLFGGDGDDVAVGGGGFQVLDGGPGNDQLDGRGGQDRLNGGEGPDELVGGAGHDRLLGGPGGDTLRSRDDKTDRVEGGPGDDRARVDPRLDVIQSIEEFF